MSELLSKYANNKPSEIPLNELRIIISELLVDSNKIMGGTTDNEDLKWIVGWVCKYIDERCGYLPMHQIRAAIEYGALGERGGTTKLMPRNIAIWLREQAGIMQEIAAKRIKIQDDKERIQHMNANKAEWRVAAAVRIKLTWLGEKMITSEEYDTFSSSEIYKLLVAGVPEQKIHPRDVVPDYYKHRENL